MLTLVIAWSACSAQPALDKPSSETAIAATDAQIDLPTATSGLPPNQTSSSAPTHSTLSQNTPAVVTEEIPAKPSFWYYADGQRVTLTLSLDEISVQFASGVSEAEKDVLMNSIPGIQDFAQAQAVPVPELTILKLQAGLSQVEYFRILEEIRTHAAIEYAYPVFAMPEARQTLTNQFIARFRSDVSKEAIQSFNAEHGVELVQAMRLPNTFILRVKAGGDSLAMANLYHESDLIEYATPDFVRFTSPFS